MIEVQNSIAFKDRLIYGFSCFGKDLVYGLINCSVFLYCIQVLDISVTFLGLLYLGHHLMGVVFTPLLGAFIDRTRSRLGKYKPYVVLGIALNAAGLCAFYFVLQIDPDLRYLYIAVVYMFWSLSFIIIDLPTWSVLSVFNTNVATRDSMSAIPTISHFIGTQLLVICVLPVLNKVPFISIADGSDYRVIVFICLLLLLISQGAFIMLLSTSPNDYLPPSDGTQHFIPPSPAVQSALHASDQNNALTAASAAMTQAVTAGATAYSDPASASATASHSVVAAGSADEDYINAMISRSGAAAAAATLYAAAGVAPPPQSNRDNGISTAQAVPESVQAEPGRAMADTSELYSAYVLERTGRQRQHNARDFYDQISSTARGAEFDPAQSFMSPQNPAQGMLHSFCSRANPLRLLNRMLKVIFNNDQLVVLFLCSILLNTMIGIVLGALITFFMERSLFDQPTIYFILLAGALIQCFSMISFSSMARQIPRSWIFNLSICMAITSFGLITIAPQNEDIFYACLAGCMFLGNIAVGLCRVAVTAMTIDTVDYGEFKFSLRTDGMVFAMRSMARHTGAMVSFFFYGGAFSLTNHINTKGVSVPEISMNLAVAIASILGITAALIFSSYYKLNGAFYRNILNNLQYLRQNQHAESGAGADGTRHFMLRYSLDESTMIIKLKARTIDDLLKAMVQKLARVNAITSEIDYMHDLRARLDLGPCGIAEGIALPHAKSASVRRATVVVATLDEPMDLGALDDRKCDLVFLLASPDDGETHLNLLGRLSLLLNESGFAEKLRTSGSPTELFERLIQCEKHIVN